MKSVLLLVGALATPLVALGGTFNLVLSVPSPIPQGTPSVTVSIMLSGPNFGGADTLLFVGDGGPSFGGTANPATSPRIVSGTMSSQNMLMGHNNAGTSLVFVDMGSGPEPLAATMSCVTITGLVPANGLLGTYTLDTSTALPGQYLLHLDPNNTAIHGIPAFVTDTTLVITPEPSAAAILLLGFPLVCRTSPKRTGEPASQY